jgi:hypothetical protein
MAIIATASIDLTKIDKSKIIEGKKGGKYLNLSIMMNDEESQYGDNVSISIGQSKEERESKSPKTFLGNGRVVWDNGTMPCKPEYKGAKNTHVEPVKDDGDVPF